MYLKKGMEWKVEVLQKHPSKLLLHTQFIIDEVAAFGVAKNYDIKPSKCVTERFQVIKQW